MTPNGKSKGHVEFIDRHEYYLIDKQLYRAEISRPLESDGRRLGQFVTTGHGAEFALRMARLAAGEPESD